MRKITRNKRRTGSAIIQNGYYNGPRHWLLLNPPPLLARGSLQIHEFNGTRARARGYRKSSWNINPTPSPFSSPVILPFCRILTATDFRGLCATTTLFLLLSSGKKYKFSTLAASCCLKAEWSTLGTSRVTCCWCWTLIIRKESGGIIEKFSRINTWEANLEFEVAICRNL